jgi:hypothetical protein
MGCNMGVAGPVTTLVSAAFTGCSLATLPGSTFPDSEFNTVTVTLVTDTLTLTALVLDVEAGVSQSPYTASWQLRDCPAASAVAMSAGVTLID